MARAGLDVLGCHAPLVEKTSLYYGAITDWLIGPAVPWTNTAPVHLSNMPEDYDPIAAGKGAIRKGGKWRVYLAEVPTQDDALKIYDDLRIAGYAAEIRPGVIIF